MKSKLHYITIYLKKNTFLIFLLLFSLFNKALRIIPDIYAFSFDHGKDSLAIMHMIKTLSPKLIGPWTSIPGLFFGASWYYLLTPGFIITNGNPIGGVFIMIILNLITIILAYKYFNKISATIIATSSTFINISTSAWNPFPMPLLMLIILINIKNKKLSNINYFLIFLSISFSFHFSSAYAIFYLLSIPIILAIKNNIFQQSTDIFKSLISQNFFTKLIISISGFTLPFIPQLIFELRHNFIETKAIFQYLTHSSTAQYHHTLLEIITTTLHEFQTLLFPEFNQLNFMNVVIKIIIIIFLFIGYKHIGYKKIPYKTEVLLLIVIPILGFSKLHFNIWYIYATFPLIAIIISLFIQKTPTYMQNTFISLLIITSTFNIYKFYTLNKYELMNNSSFLSTKLKTIEIIRQKTGDKPFASYQYEPAIYDFAWQYIYIWQAFQGKKLPVEFSYKPNAPTYIPEKSDLLKLLKIDNRKPEYIFYIVEKPQYDNFLQDWWHSQHYSKIISQTTIGSGIILYQALP